MVEEKRRRRKRGGGGGGGGGRGGGGGGERQIQIVVLFRKTTELERLRKGRTGVELPVGSGGLKLTGVPGGSRRKQQSLFQNSWKHIRLLHSATFPSAVRRLDAHHHNASISIDFILHGESAEMRNTLDIRDLAGGTNEAYLQLDSRLQKDICRSWRFLTELVRNQAAFKSTTEKMNLYTDQPGKIKRHLLPSTSITSPVHCASRAPSGRLGVVGGAARDRAADLISHLSVRGDVGGTSVSASLRVIQSFLPITEDEAAASRNDQGRPFSSPGIPAGDAREEHLLRDNFSPEAAAAEAPRPRSSTGACHRVKPDFGACRRDGGKSTIGAGVRGAVQSRWC
ncbi:unnamed protein product [Pleuronectes platessa]|uniref:Uncharacterized protein n=1 Tax=Pleuronectes platessa TaxID=8262 RepID=A0A9N7Z7C9_PLEPL|nr:unnamed protein product [Pleuronectes platessa]